MILNVLNVSVFFPEDCNGRGQMPPVLKPRRTNSKGVKITGGLEAVNGGDQNLFSKNSKKIIHFLKSPLLLRDF